ncbi:MAG: pirin family protein [Bryobacterales bacterium]|nr:pirin family protein [Bryobacterales bacterium]
MKNVVAVFSNPRTHWVGDGFPVRSLFSYQSHGKTLSPFLLLDYAGPAEFPAGGQNRGVGEHPHRGFETVTIVYKGEVAHRDSTGMGGVIGPGDVQWMTAASGILHEEFHSDAFTRAGGTMEMLQLWVNLPAKDKMSPPKYQAIPGGEIPNVALPDGAGTVRLIAGSYAGREGAASTFTPMQVWDVRLRGGGRAELPAPEGWSAALVVLSGTVHVNGGEAAKEGQLVVFEQGGEGVRAEAEGDSVVVLLSGEPIAEPIVGHGPFVMNTQAEIGQAIEDFRRGRFGRIER